MSNVTEAQIKQFKRDQKKIRSNAVRDVNRVTSQIEACRRSVLTIVENMEKVGVADRKNTSIYKLGEAYTHLYEALKSLNRVTSSTVNVDIERVSIDNYRLRTAQKASIRLKRLR